MFPRIVTLSATNVTMFEYTDMMKKLFEKQAEVEQVSDFWEVGYIYLNIIKYYKSRPSVLHQQFEMSFHFPAAAAAI